MRLLTRVVAAGIAVALAALSLVAPAQAADNKQAAAKAAAYVAAALGGADHLTSDFGDEGVTADAVLALVSVQDASYSDEIARMLSYLKAKAPAYAQKSPEGAAKLALVAVAVKEKPTDFGSVDLVAKVKAGIKQDGSFGTYPGAFAQSLGIIALKRAGETVPDPMVTWLVAQQDAASGGFGYELGQAPDADNTGMALMALSALSSDKVATAKQAAQTWVQKNQGADGSWAGYSPVNSTAVAGMALLTVGADNAKAVSWTAAQQGADGGLLNAGQPDLLATLQGVLLLRGASYLSVQVVEGFPLTWVLSVTGLVIAAASMIVVVARRKDARVR